MGKGRITPALVAETKRTLEAHELIKVRIDVDEGTARRELARAGAGNGLGTRWGDREAGDLVPAPQGGPGSNSRDS